MTTSLSEINSLYRQVNQAYTKKRGAGIKNYVVPQGGTIDNTPFQQILGILTRFGADSITNPSKGATSIQCLGSLNRCVTTAIRILNDRIAILWRGSIEDDTLTIFQSGVFLIHEIARTVQALTSVQYHLKYLFQPQPSNRNSRVASMRSVTTSVSQLGKQLLHRIDFLVQRTMSQFQVRMDQFLVSCTCKLVDLSNNKQAKSLSFRNCALNQPWQFRPSTGKSVSTQSSVSTRGVICTSCPWRVWRRGSKVESVSSSMKGDDSAADSPESSLVSPTKIKPSKMTGWSGSNSGGPLGSVRLMALVPLYQATQTHSEHPQSMQILSLCINAALEHFMIAVTKVIQANGIDASGIMCLFHQVHDLRSWIISIRQEMGLPVLLQEIGPWVRVEEIVSVLTGSYEELSGRSSAPSSRRISEHGGNAAQGARGRMNRPIRRNPNGSIESGSTALDEAFFNDTSKTKRCGRLISGASNVASIMTNSISQCGRSVASMYQLISWKKSTVAPMPAEMAHALNKERQIEDLLSGRILLRENSGALPVNTGNAPAPGENSISAELDSSRPDVSVNRVNDERNDGRADDVIPGSLLASLIPLTSEDDAQSAAARAAAEANALAELLASQSTRGENQSLKTFLSGQGLEMKNSLVYLRDTKLWSDFSSVLARKHALVTQPHSALTLPELKMWKSHASHVATLSITRKEKYLGSCVPKINATVAQLKNIRVETWDM